MLSPPTGTAIFLVVRVNPGGEQAVRGLLPDLAGLQRSVGARVPAGALACVAGIGSAAWDRLFSGPRPAGLHPFPELAGSKYIAIATPGDLFFHIKAMTMNLCFEMTAQIMDRLSGAVTVEDEVHGFRYFEERDLLGFVGGTENPGWAGRRRGRAGRARGPAVHRRQLRHLQKYLHDMRPGTPCRSRSRRRCSAARSCPTSRCLPGPGRPTPMWALTAAAGPGRAQRQILRDKMPFGSAGHPPPYRTGRAHQQPDQKRSGGQFHPHACDRRGRRERPGAAGSRLPPLSLRRQQWYRRDLLLGQVLPADPGGRPWPVQRAAVDDALGGNDQVHRHRRDRSAGSSRPGGPGVRARW